MIAMVYLPKHFAETRSAELAGLMQRYSFATIVTQGDGGLIASQLPFMYRAEEGPHGTLLCHLAKPNPQVDDLRAGREVLVIFSGPHAYVSTSWYATRPAARPPGGSPTSPPSMPSAWSGASSASPFQ